MGDPRDETSDGDSQAWYYARDGAQLGPVSFEELVAEVHGGRLVAGDLVWREGMGDWQPASSVPGLFAEDMARVEPVDPYEVAAVAPQPLPPPPVSPAGPYAQPVPTPLPYGQPLGYAPPPPGAGNQMGLAVGGFVCSIVAIPMMCCASIIGVPLSIVGLILGIVAKRGMDRSGNLQGRGLAIAAIVIAIAEIVLCVAMIVVYIVIMATQQRP